MIGTINKIITRIDTEFILNTELQQQKLTTTLKKVCFNKYYI